MDWRVNTATRTTAAIEQGQSITLAGTPQRARRIGFSYSAYVTTESRKAPSSSTRFVRSGSS
jgi:hypothetical protein